ncbi:MAG: hypothetical protein AAGA25_14830 [Planctomycetota bacterium]
MLPSTREVFRAITGNGYEVRTDRKKRSEGTMVWLLSQAKDEEAFYFFSHETETQVIDTIASQYCTPTQRMGIFGEATSRPHELAEPHFDFA